MDTYKTYRHLLPTAHPRWPLGLPGWRDDWIALALTLEEDSTVLTVCRRDGALGMVSVPLPWVPEGQCPRVLFATGSGPSLHWDSRERVLRVGVSSTTAVLIAFGGLGTGR
ncbi:hypothetical protein [Streptomyces sp. A30]|uniref:hypothetical protein n=1 Tax=Streptomyces sp. A30 TaxID=2789273 RepID=UPI00397EEF3C